MMSGTETSFATETELDVESSQIGLENDAFLTIEASAVSKTVPLNSSHVMPEMDSDTATTGVRVGCGVGMGAVEVGDEVAGVLVGMAVGATVGAVVGMVVGV